jgi:hypothetical protein
VDYLFRLQRSATVLSIGVSLWFLVRLWREGELFGAQARLFCVWFVGAVALQLFAQSTGIWIAALLAQSLLAIVLVAKDRIDNIY